MFVVARTIDDLAGMESALRREIAGVDPTIVIYAVNTVDGLVSEAIAQPRFRTMVLSGLAAVALTLAAVGLYGVVAYTVAQRTAEIGIRIALGATAANVVRMVLREGMLLVLVGLAIGVGSALALTRILRNLLYGVQPTDMLSFVGAAATLLLVTFLASYIPARRATRVDPLAALRCE
jgi:putative ABC transport system permease protein